MTAGESWPGWPSAAAKGYYPQVYPTSFMAAPQPYMYVYPQLMQPRLMVPIQRVSLPAAGSPAKSTMKAASHSQHEAAPPPAALPKDAPAGLPKANGAASPAAPSAAAPDLPPGSVRPRWYVRAEALWLDRSRSQRVFLGEVQDLTTVPNVSVVGVLSTEDGDFQYEPGVRLVVGYYLSTDVSIEWLYSGMQSWDTSASLGIGDPLNNALDSNFLFLGGGFPGTYTFRYEADLHNAELNLRSGFVLNDRWSAAVLGGARYIHLGEDFALSANDPVTLTSEETRATTDNNLVGLQCGGELTRRWKSRWSAAVRGKAGLYANFADQNLTHVFNDPVLGPTQLLDVSVDGTVLAGSIETGLRVSYRVGGNVILHGGYEVLLLQGLALAPEQFTSLNNDITNLTITPGRTGNFLNDAGSAVFHGPSIGAEVSW